VPGYSAAGPGAIRPRWQAVRAIVPLVQVPPRGLWSTTGPAAHSSAEVWLARVKARKMTVAQLILRYLGAFGPATVADMQTWSGLSGLRAVVEQMRRRLRVFRGPDSEELFDLPEAPRPRPDTCAPPRFLPEFDNLLLSHADRARIVLNRYRGRITSGGMVPGTVLVDGFVSARWRITGWQNLATLIVEPFDPVWPADQNQIHEEGHRLLAFLAPDAFVRQVRIAPPGP
jgi:hypothetical protein